MKLDARLLRNHIDWRWLAICLSAVELTTLVLLGVIRPIWVVMVMATVLMLIITVAYVTILHRPGGVIVGNTFLKIASITLLFITTIGFLANHIS